MVVFNDANDVCCIGNAGSCVGGSLSVLHADDREDIGEEDVEDDVSVEGGAVDIFVVLVAEMAGD